MFASCWIRTFVCFKHVCRLFSYDKCDMTVRRERDVPRTMSTDCLLYAVLAVSPGHWDTWSQECGPLMRTKMEAFISSSFCHETPLAHKSQKVHTCRDHREQQQILKLSESIAPPLCIGETSTGHSSNPYFVSLCPRGMWLACFLTVTHKLIIMLRVPHRPPSLISAPLPLLPLIHHQTFSVFRLSPEPSLDWNWR